MSSVCAITNANSKKTKERFLFKLFECKVYDYLFLSVHVVLFTIITSISRRFDVAWTTSRSKDSNEGISYHLRMYAPP